MAMVPAIQRSSVVSGNRWITDRLVRAKMVIMEGALVSEAFAGIEVFPPAAIHVIGVGEETSSIADMVRYAANMYEEEADMALTVMANTLEPVIMAVMGVVVGFIVIASILPTLSLINNL
jgi:type IV pilus assembly protein PilC